MESPHQLIDDHLDGELSDDGFRRLGSWLRECDGHVRDFARAWLLHSLIHDHVCQRQVQAGALWRAMTTSNGDARSATLAERAVSLAGRSSVEPSDRRAMPGPIDRSSIPRYALGVLAGAMLCALAAGVWIYHHSRPRVVAMLTESAHCRWEAAGSDLAEGALLNAGDELRLSEGHALLTFSSGARVVIEGPAGMTIDSEWGATLAEGALTAKVPTQAVGFTITTLGVRLIDRGTEFTVRSGGEDSFELQVFEGMVELSLPGDAPLQISEGTAVTASVPSRRVESVPYDVGKRISMPSQVERPARRP
jgi:hypothetical protein